MHINIMLDKKTIENILKEAADYGIDNLEEFIEYKLEELYG